MAERRMFTKKVTDGDDFMALSSSAQALYLHLSMSADDDGFCNQVTLSMFKAHASVQDLEALLEKRYIYQFENGVIVIKHWRMANALRKDRHVATSFQEELAKLGIEKNGSYTWLPDGCQMVAKRLPQDSIDKDSIEEDRIDKDIEELSGKPVDVEKKPKSRKKEELMTVYYPNDEVLNKNFADFVEARNQGKHPFHTNRAIELAMKKLDKLSGGDNNLAVEIIEQSIIRGWESFYELPSQKTTPNNANRSLYADLDEWLARKEQEEEEKRQNGI